MHGSIFVWCVHFGFTVHVDMNVRFCEWYVCMYVCMYVCTLAE